MTCWKEQGSRYENILGPGSARVASTWISWFRRLLQGQAAEAHDSDRTANERRVAPRVSKEHLSIATRAR